MQLDKKVIGHEFKAFSSTAEASQVKLFCKAIGEEDLFQTDQRFSSQGQRAANIDAVYATLKNDNSWAMGSFQVAMKALRTATP